MAGIGRVRRLDSALANGRKRRTAEAHYFIAGFPLGAGKRTSSSIEAKRRWTSLNRASPAGNLDRLPGQEGEGARLETLLWQGLRAEPNGVLLPFCHERRHRRKL